MSEPVVGTPATLLSKGLDDCDRDVRPDEPQFLDGLWSFPCDGRWPRLSPIDRIGLFCATYDVLMSAHFYVRRQEWQTSWSGSTAASRGVVGNP